MSYKNLEHLKKLYELGKIHENYKPYASVNFRQAIKRMERQFVKGKCLNLIPDIVKELKKK